jgi:hypothetical protein
MKTHGTPIYLDIETIPGQHPNVLAALKAEADDEKKAIKAPANYKDEDKIAEYVMAKQAEIDTAVDARWRKTSFDGALGQVCAVSVAIGYEAPINIYKDEWETAEPYILGELYRVIADAYSPNCDMRPVFVGHNVVAFDLRFIFQRSVLLGVKPHPIIPFTARPWDAHVFDTMTQWAGVGNRVSLDKLCRVFGIPTKGTEIGDEIDGSKVWDFVKAGRIKDVALYCGGDVERVREIHRRMTFAHEVAA